MFSTHPLVRQRDLRGRIQFTIRMLRSDPNSQRLTARKPSRQSPPNPTISYGSSGDRLVHAAATLVRRCATGRFARTLSCSNRVVDSAQGRVETLPPIRIQRIASDQPLERLGRGSPAYQSTVDVSLTEKEIPQRQIEQ